MGGDGSQAIAVPLDSEKLVALLRPGGILSHALRGYEARPQQEAMLLDVVEAFNQKKLTLIEAGTGTGKSLAYLLPSLMWALKHQQRVLVSTNTIALQEQLINKDIPFLVNSLGLDIKVVLAKGMGNYLCIRKMQEALQEVGGMEENEAKQLEQIQEWGKECKEGSRSELPFIPMGAVWEKVCAESDACSHMRCPHYRECHFYKARAEAEEAQIIVVNHHLLFSDFIYRKVTNNFEETAILPLYHHIILDEAHHIESVALEHMAAHLSRWDLTRILGRLSGDAKKQNSGKLALLKQRLMNIGALRNDHRFQSLLYRIDMDLPGQRRQLMSEIHQVFDHVDTFIQEVFAKKESEKQCRLLPKHFDHIIWKEEIYPELKGLQNSLTRFSQALASLDEDVKDLHESSAEKTASVRLDIQAVVKRLENYAQILDLFIHPDEEDWKTHVRWCEWTHFRNQVNISLVRAPLDVSQMLREEFFPRFATGVLCSATLATNRNFQFVKKRLGISLDSRIQEKIYDSPFNFERQALLAVPSNLPEPSESSYIPRVSEYIKDLMDACRGNAFILFTSYQMMQSCYDLCLEPLKSKGFNVLKQGHAYRMALLDTFRNTDRSVLFATDSFWEGVDVVGEALRCVVIAKLPFKVPTEPLTQAQAEAIEAQGNDPFMEYSLPHAIMKFKQGFGRLIRNQKDRGAIVCLDKRIISKNYGKMFTNSLPRCPILYEETDVLLKAIKNFYSNGNREMR